MRESKIVEGVAGVVNMSVIFGKKPMKRFIKEE